MLDRLGATAPGMEVGEGELWRLAESAGIYSPVRLRNRIESGTLAAPDVLLVDECHHATASSATVFERLVAAIGSAPVLGWTATPYRGSHAETEALRVWWEAPQVLLGIDEACSERWLSAPVPKTWGLLDDAEVVVRAGEYDAESIAEQSAAQGLIASLIGRLLDENWHDGVRWSRPTMVAGPTVEWCQGLATQLTAAGLPARPISGDVPRIERDRLLGACAAGELALVQVKVLAEGVDMPWLRRLVDCRPLRSPVAWMQLLGRITRPVGEDEPPPEYVTVCRNLQRHAYLWAGTWPARSVATEAQKAFGGSTGNGASGDALERGLARDALGRRARFEIPLNGGGRARGTMICREHGRFGEHEEHVLAIAVPGEEVPRVFARRVEKGGSTWTWTKWAVANLDATGYRGWTRDPQKGQELSTRQIAWWRKDAAAYGLDPDGRVDREVFAVLPALVDTQTTLAQPNLSELSPASSPTPTISIRPSPIEPPAIEGPIAANWARLADGSWGARVQEEHVKAGAEIEIVTRDGRKERRRVVSVEARGRGFAVCRTAAAPVVAPSIEPGYYATTSTAGQTAFWRVTKAAGLWSGWVFLSSVKAGGLEGLVETKAGARRPDGSYTGSAQTTFDAILADPAEAMARFGRDVGMCGRCGLALTDETSRAIGLGPVCRGKP